MGGEGYEVPRDLIGLLPAERWDLLTSVNGSDKGGKVREGWMSCCVVSTEENDKQEADMIEECLLDPVLRRQ